MWLTCEVGGGMFPGEVSVTIDAADSKLSLFLPAENVQRDSQHGGLISVSLLDENAEFGLVSLPGASLEGAQVVKVSRQHLK